MKKSLLLAIVCCSFVLVGCGKSATVTVDSSSQNTDTATESKEMFSVSSCNSYVNLMKCIVEKSTAEVKPKAQESFDQIVALWKTLTPEQLQSACDANMQSVNQQKQVVENMGCSIE